MKVICIRASTPEAPTSELDNWQINNAALLDFKMSAPSAEPSDVIIGAYLGASY